MNKIFYIKAPAKVNLNLFVKEKLNNGLHLLESDICFVELTDNIFFQFSEEDVFLQDNLKKQFLINPHDNLILNALNKFRQLTGWNKNFSIYLQKKIPIGAGLGGGSADAAATLILLRRLFNYETKFHKLSKNALFEIGKSIGSDVPACIESKDLKLKGYGDKIKKNKMPYNFYFLIINPNIKLSTKDVFDHFEKNSDKKIQKTNMFWEKINIYNSLVSSAVFLEPEILNVLDSFKKSINVVAYGMTGSGSSCFGIYNNLSDIENSLKYFKKEYFIWFGKKKNYNINRVGYCKVLENKF
jgi:4-diphosphocytidyl-2-C-methyl-D-erythritol kinase